VLELELDSIKPNPHQPRKEFAAVELAELAASIGEFGLLQPVVVRPAGAGYELLVGERRLRAARIAGLRRIPALVREAADKEALEQALVENLQRADLRPLEEAYAYRGLVDMFELTQEEVGRRVGKSRVHVTNTLRLLELPPAVRELLDTGRLTAGHARAILALRDETAREALARRAADEGMSVRQVEELARTWPQGKPSVPRRVTRAAWPDLEEALSDRLGTRVRIESGRGRGRIVVTFGSREDLDRIAKLLLSPANASASLTA
jgi:ParB family chromosome partitioning protein